ncbi:hypothetical protein P7C73_g6855, partial [Tremellales sp. Uapishka_1]
MGHKKVALKGVKTLTFFADKKTTGRRTSPIPQLECVGKACRGFQPQVIQCTNNGDDGAGSIQWRCDTDLPSSLRLGKTDVSCEGWSAAGDSNILQGSCALQYNLYTIDKSFDSTDPFLPRSELSLLSNLFWLLFAGIAIMILWSFIKNFFRSPDGPGNDGRNRPYPWGGWGGG